MTRVAPGTVPQGKALQSLSESREEGVLWGPQPPKH